MGDSTTPPQTDKGAVLKAARKHKTKEGVPCWFLAPSDGLGKLTGRLHYFGKVDPNLPDFGAGETVGEFHRTIDDIRAGRHPPRETATCLPSRTPPICS